MYTVEEEADDVLPRERKAGMPIIVSAFSQPSSQPSAYHLHGFSSSHVMVEEAYSSKIS